MAQDPLLSDPARKRKRPGKADRKAERKLPRDLDEDISSDSDGSDPSPATDDGRAQRLEDGEISSDEEFQAESAGDKRRRLAKQYLQNLKESEMDGQDYNAEDLDHDNLSRRLQMDVAESKGSVFRHYAAQIQKQLPEVAPACVRIGSRNLTGVAVKYPYIYTVSKDTELIKWKAGHNNKPQRIKHTKGTRRQAPGRTPNQGVNHHHGAINCVAASGDGRFVVTGGEDGRLIIWSAENLACIKVLETRALVNAIVFRRDSDQLYAAGGDLRIRTYSINQFAQLEILYGHQDNICDISALARETCVSVGSRDKTAMLWKIADELRLTFRGGDYGRKNANGAPFYAEGSMEAVCMVDESHFVSGSDNGNLSLWSLWKKKPIYTQRLAHGLVPLATPAHASAETLDAVAAAQVPEPQPYWLTAVHAIPYSDFFLTGSYSGEVKLWRIEAESLRSFSLMGSVAVRGCVVKIADAVLKDDKKLVVYVATSKEHRLGRWLGKVDGRNALTAITFNV